MGQEIKFDSPMKIKARNDKDKNFLWFNNDIKAF